MMTEKNDDSWLVLLVFPFAMAFALVVMVWRAYVLTWLWQWFIVPAYSVQPMELVTATGIILLVAMFMPTKSRKTKATEMVAKGIFVPGIILGFGWIAYTWL